MLTTEECLEMNVRTGKFSDDVEMTVEPNLLGSTVYVLFATQAENTAKYNTRKNKLQYGETIQYNILQYSKM